MRMAARKVSIANRTATGTGTVQPAIRRTVAVVTHQQRVGPPHRGRTVRPPAGAIELIGVILMFYAGGVVSDCSVAELCGTQQPHRVD